MDACRSMCLCAFKKACECQFKKWAFVGEKAATELW